MLIDLCFRSTLPPCTNLHQAGSRAVMASFCRTGLANCGLLQTHSAALGLQQCAERVFLPMICCPVCEKRNYVASLIYFDFLFCSLLQIWRQPLEYKSVLPFCFVFQILLSYSNLQKHPRMFAGHLFAKRVRWPWTHTDRVVIVLTTLYVFFFLFLSPSSVLTRSCLMTHPVPLICLWCDGVMVH